MARTYGLTRSIVARALLEELAGMSGDLDADAVAGRDEIAGGLGRTGHRRTWHRRALALAPAARRSR